MNLQVSITLDLKPLYEPHIMPRLSVMVSRSLGVAIRDSPIERGISAAVSTYASNDIDAPVLTLRSYLSIYAAIVVVMMMLVVFIVFWILYGSIRAARIVHRRLIRSVLCTTLR